MRGLVLRSGRREWGGKKGWGKNGHGGDKGGRRDGGKGGQRRGKGRRQREGREGARGAEGREKIPERLEGRGGPPQKAPVTWAGGATDQAYEDPLQGGHGHGPPARPPGDTV